MRPEFEDGLRTGVLPGTLVVAQDELQTPLGVGVAPGSDVFVIRTPVRPNSDSAELSHQWCLNYSWCDVRIELAIGSLP